jgi:hypothetical protein
MRHRYEIRWSRLPELLGLTVSVFVFAAFLVGFI